MLPIKSIIRRPSQYRPAGPWKKDSPWGGPACPNATDNPPVSEFESPKLNIAGNSQGVLLLADTESRFTKSNNNAARKIFLWLSGVIGDFPVKISEYF